MRCAFVHSPDRDGLFAAIVATLDRLGLAIQHARLLDGPNATVFDTFVVLPADPRRPVAAADIEARLSATLAGALDAVRPAAPQRRATCAISASRRRCSSPIPRTAAAPCSAWSAPTAPGCWPTSRNCCARTACACMMRASRPSANAPRTCSASPTNRTARCPRRPDRHCTTLQARIDGEPSA